MKQYKTILLFFGLFSGVLLLAIAIAFFEARSYNKLTGSNTTTWDAFFLDLRVVSEPKQKANE